MADGNWDELWEAFHGALRLQGAAREAFVAEVAARDPACGRRLGRLLAAHARASGILDDVDERRFDAPADPLIGRQVGPYVLTRVIGEGGMGIVYEAEQSEPVRRRAALKLIRPGMDTREVVARFEAERRALALMEHPAIATIFDAGATEWGAPYVVMELVAGVPVTDYCRDNRLDLRERLELFLRVCSGVQHAHQKGIIHRDLKPSNVLVSERDGAHVAKIIDFGIAKATGPTASRDPRLTSAGIWVGTPEYMSPEQIEQTVEEVDTRSDIYGLGMLLYEMLTDLLPFEAERFRSSSVDEMRRLIREQQPPRPSERAGRRELAGDLDWITLKALEKDPERRYPSAAELAADIRRHLRDEPVAAGPPGASYLLLKFVRRHRVGVGVGVAVVALLIAFAATMAFQAQRIARERDRANEEAQRAAREARTAQQVTDFLVGLFRLSDPLAGRGGETSAREILDRGARSLEQRLEDEPEISARLLATIGTVYGNLGLYEDAGTSMEKALAIRRDSLGANHPDVAGSLQQIALLRSSEGDYSAAVELFEEAIGILEENADADESRLIEAWRGLSHVLKALGRYDESAAMQKRVLASYEERYGSDDGRVGAVARDLGLILVDAGDLAGAREALGRSLAILEDTFGPDDPQVGFVLNGLSIAHWKDGEYEEARPLLERAIVILEGVYTRDHPLLLGLHGNHARLIHDLGQLDEARPLYEKTLALQQARLGPDHPDLAFTLGNLASLLRDTGELDEAQRLYRRGIRIREDKLGADHPLLADMLEGYAQVLHKKRLTSQAVEAEKRAAAIRAR